MPLRPMRDPPDEIALYPVKTFARVVDERPPKCRGIALHAEFSPADAELVGLDVLNHRCAGHTVKERLLNRRGVIRLAPVTRFLKGIRCAVASLRRCMPRGRFGFIRLCRDGHRDEGCGAKKHPDGYPLSPSPPR